MTDYVLVHGAWGGSFAYDRLAGELRSAGHRVVVAQLAGLGTRKGEFHPGITLTTHIDDVCNQIASAGLDRFVLVGQSLWDLTGDFEHNHYIGSQKFTPGAVAPLPGLESPVLSAHPLLTLLEAVRFTGEEAKVGRRVYIFANAWEPTPFRQFVSHVTSEPGWEYHEAAASHNVMGDQPEQTLTILLGCA